MKPTRAAPHEPDVGASPPLKVVVLPHGEGLFRSGCAGRELDGQRVHLTPDPDGDSGMTKLGVFLVDDHPIVLDGLKALINAQPDMTVVGEAADGFSAVEAVTQLGPDIVLMDVTMPRLGGAQATERIKQARPEVHVVALTGYAPRGTPSRRSRARLDLSARTVETYEVRAMEKLGLTSRADTVRYALQQGWLKND